jgi:hypothetical protein
MGLFFSRNSHTLFGVAALQEESRLDKFASTSIKHLQALKGILVYALLIFFGVDIRPPLRSRLESPLSVIHFPWKAMTHEAVALLWFLAFFQLQDPASNLNPRERLRASISDSSISFVYTFPLRDSRGRL